MFGCAYDRIADDTVSATTLRRRRDEWLATDCGITKAPGGGELAGPSPVDRGKQGRKRSVVVDAAGIPLGTIAAPANRHDSPLLEATLEALVVVEAPMTVHLDRGYDSGSTRTLLADRGLAAEIAARGQPSPVTAGRRWVLARTHAWTNAHKKLVWRTERRAAVVAFWLTCSAVIIIVGRLVREGWIRYRWVTRPHRKP